MIIDSLRRREHLAAIARRLPVHVDRLSWTSDQIAAERQRALREMLTFARSNSPWHAARLRDIDPAAFTEAGLCSLPPMTKADVMGHWDEIVTDRRLTLADSNAHIAAKLDGRTQEYYYLNDYLVIATGGSSGVRGVFPWGWDEFIEIACATFRYQLRDAPPETLSGERLLAVVEAGHIVHGSPFLFSVSTDPDAQVRWCPASTPIVQLVAALNAAQPTQINAFASSVQELAVEALQGRLKIAPERVTSNSEPLLAETREVARQAWGVEINNMWGCVEVGHIGIECDAHEGLHLSDDLIITEFVDHDGNATTDPDAVDHVLVTSLFGRTLPLIRYVLTDAPVLSDQTCSCGAAFPLIKTVKGRSGEVFFYDGGIRIHPLVFATPLRQNSHIEQYQVHQTRRGARIAVIATGPLDVSALHRQLVSELAAAGLADAEIEIDVVDALERNAETGKLKRFIPLARS